jgi:hypothetical protein
MTKAVGRPIAPLVLSSDERAYFERQVRRRRVACSLSERTRLLPLSNVHFARRQTTPPTGRSGRWQRRRAFRTRPSGVGLQPHRSLTFKLSSDPLFVDKVRDIVGLYLSRPIARCAQR